MSAYKILKANTNVLDLTYWGVDNLRTAHEATVAVDNYAQFKQEMDAVSGSVNVVDDICDYFLLLKWVKMEEVVPLLKTAEQREQLQSLVVIAKDRVTQFKKGDIIVFVNEHFAELLEERATQGIVFDFILKMQNGIKDEVFLYLVKEQAHLCVRNFMDLKKKFQKDAILSKTLLQEEKLIDLLIFDYKGLYSILALLYKDVGFANGKHIVEDAIKQLEEYFDALLLQKDCGECVNFSEAIKSFYRLLVEIKHIYAKKEPLRNKQIAEQEQEWLKTNGKIYTHSFSIEEIMEGLHTEISPLQKFVLLTQRRNQETQCLESYFEGEIQANAFLDLLAKESANDAYFTHSKIQANKLQLQIGGAVIRNIFLDEKLEGELISVLRNLLIDLQTVISIDAQEMLNEIMMALISIKEAEEIVQNKETETCAGAYGARCYAAQMLLCASIEKLLRCFYKEKVTMYVADSMIQLGGLVKDETIIQPALGQGLMKAVGYELSRYAHIGDDLRNRLAHLNGVPLKTLTVQKGYELYFLYLCVLSRIGIYCASSSQKDAECT